MQGEGREEAAGGDRREEAVERSTERGKRGGRVGRKTSRRLEGG